MGWFDRLKGKASEKNATEAQRRLPTVEALVGYPGLTPPAAPKNRNTTPEQYEREVAAYRKSMRLHFAAIATLQDEMEARFSHIPNHRLKATSARGSARRETGAVASLDR
jgi:hypothetical protein